MSIKKAITSCIRKHHPPTAGMMWKMRREIRNTSASFLCPNCIGAHLFHDMGLQFRSPTVNLMLYQTDFVKWFNEAGNDPSYDISRFIKKG